MVKKWNPARQGPPDLRVRDGTVPLKYTGMTKPQSTFEPEFSLGLHIRVGNHLLTQKLNPGCLQWRNRLLLFFCKRVSSPNCFPWLPHCLGGGGTIAAKPRVLHLSGPPGLAKAQDRLATSCVVSSAWMAMASLQTALGSVRGPLVHGQMMSGVFSDHFPSGLAKQKGLNLLFTAKFESVFLPLHPWCFADFCH